MTPCDNEYCPVGYNPKRKPCKDCQHNADELVDNEALKFFKDLFDKNKDKNE